MGDEMTFEPIQPEDFAEKVHAFLRWNMKPLTFQEVMASKNIMLCPGCKRARYVMWTSIMPMPFTPMGNYCTCE